LAFTFPQRNLTLLKEYWYYHLCETGFLVGIIMKTHKAGTITSICDPEDLDILEPYGPLRPVTGLVLLHEEDTENQARVCKVLRLYSTTDNSHVVLLAGKVWAELFRWVTPRWTFLRTMPIKYSEFIYIILHVRVLIE
jgi:hypothetical protein